MMMLYRLVRLIETHSQALAACLLDRVQKSELTRNYQTSPRENWKNECMRSTVTWVSG